MNPITSRDGTQIYYKDRAAALSSPSRTVGRSTLVGHSRGGGEVVRYPGAPHGLTATHQDQINADLLAFLRG